MTDTSSDNRQMLSDLPEAPVQEQNGQQDNTTLPGQPQQESFSDVAVKPECGAVEKQTPPNKTAGQEKQETSALRPEEDNLFGVPGWCKTVAVPNGALSTCCFSPPDVNGEATDMLAFAGWNKQVNLRCLKTGKRVWDNDKQLTGAVMAITFSRNATYIAVASQDGEFKVFNVDTGVELHPQLDSSLAHSASKPSRVGKLCCLPQNNQVRPLSSAKIRTCAVMSCCFSPVDDIIATAGADGRVEVFQICDMELKKQFEWFAVSPACSVRNGPAAVVLTCCFSPDGTRLAAGIAWCERPKHSVNNVVILDALNGREAGKGFLTCGVSTSSYIPPVMACSFSADSKFIAAGDRDGNLILANVKTCSTFWRTKHTGALRFCHFLPPRQQKQGSAGKGGVCGELVVGGEDGTVTLRDQATGDKVWSKAVGCENTQTSLLACCVSSQGHYIAAVGETGNSMGETGTSSLLRVFDAQSGEDVFHNAFDFSQSSMAWLQQCCFSTDGKYLAVVGGEIATSTEEEEEEEEKEEEETEEEKAEGGEGKAEDGKKEKLRQLNSIGVGSGRLLVCSLLAKSHTSLSPAGQQSEVVSCHAALGSDSVAAVDNSQKMTLYKGVKQTRSVSSVIPWPFLVPSDDTNSENSQDSFFRAFPQVPSDGPNSENSQDEKLYFFRAFPQDNQISLHAFSNSARRVSWEFKFREEGIEAKHLRPERSSYHCVMKSDTRYPELCVAVIVDETIKVYKTYEEKDFFSTSTKKHFLCYDLAQKYPALKDKSPSACCFSERSDQGMRLAVCTAVGEIFVLHFEINRYGELSNLRSNQIDSNPDKSNSPKRLLTCRFSSDGKYLAVGGQGGVLCIYDTTSKSENLEELCAIDATHPKGLLSSLKNEAALQLKALDVDVLSCCLSSDLKYLVAGGKQRMSLSKSQDEHLSGWVSVWELEKKEKEKGEETLWEAKEIWALRDLPAKVTSCAFLTPSVQLPGGEISRRGPCIVVGHGAATSIFDVTCVPLPDKIAGPPDLLLPAAEINAGRPNLNCLAFNHPGFVYRRNPKGETLLHLVAKDRSAFKALFAYDEKFENFCYTPSLSSLHSAPSPAKVSRCRRFWNRLFRACRKTAAVVPGGNRTPVCCALENNQRETAQDLLKLYLPNLAQDQRGDDGAGALNETSALARLRSLELLSPAIPKICSSGFSDTVSLLLRHAMPWLKTGRGAIKQPHERITGVPKTFYRAADFEDRGEEQQLQAQHLGNAAVDVKEYAIALHDQLFREIVQQAYVPVKYFDPDECGSVLWCIVTFKWKTYGKQIHTTMFLVFLVECGVYAYLASSSCTRGSRTAAGLRSASCALSSLFLFHEFLQFCFLGWKRFFRSGWNWVDVFAHTGVLGTSLWVSSTVGQTCSFWFRAGCGWVLVFLSITLIGLLRPYEQTGALVRMLIKIIWDVRWFMILQLVLLFGFVGSLAILLEDGGKKSGSLSMPLAILSGFVMMLGDWETDELHQDQDLVAQINAAGVFVIYIFIVTIICMNTLIAIMGDSYDRIKEKEQAESMLQQAEVLFDIDALFGRLLFRSVFSRALGKCQRRCRRSCKRVVQKCRCGHGQEQEERERKIEFSRVYPQYLRVVQPVEASMALEEPEWSGKIKELRRHFDKELRRHFDKLNEKLLQLQAPRVQAAAADNEQEGKTKGEEDAAAGDHLRAMFEEKLEAISKQNEELRANLQDQRKKADEKLKMIETGLKQQNAELTQQNEKLQQQNKEINSKVQLLIDLIGKQQQQQQQQQQQEDSREEE